MNVAGLVERLVLARERVEVGVVAELVRVGAELVRVGAELVPNRTEPNGESMNVAGLVERLVLARERVEVGVVAELVPSVRSWSTWGQGGSVEVGVVAELVPNRTESNGESMNVAGP